MPETVEFIFVITTAACIVANLGIAAADFLNAQFVHDNLTELSLPHWPLPYLAALKTAGALGLVAGLTVSEHLGLAAAIGLVLFFAGAVGAHFKARVLYNLYFPGTYLILAVSALVYFSASI